MTPDLAAFLSAAVAARKNIMIAGATNAGKTTLLRALANEIPPHERLITVERALELGLGEFEDLHPNVVAFEERLPNSEGQGAIPMAELVRRSLRMNPSRVIVGEVLGDEIVTMLNAMSQGNDGSLSTIHANSSLEVFNRICTYAIQSVERLPADATMMLIAGAIDFVVFVERRNDYAERRRPAPHRDQRPRGQRRRRPGAVQRGLRAGPGRAGRARPRRSPAWTSSSRSATSRRHDRRGWAHVTDLRPRRPLLIVARSARAVGGGVAAAGARADPRGPAPGGRRRRRRCVPSLSRSASRLPLGVGVGLLVLVLTRWPVAALAAGALAFVGPALFGGARRRSRAIARLDGLAAWTESLRDTIAGAVGLEQAIPATGVRRVAGHLRASCARSPTGCGSGCRCRRRCSGSPTTSTTPAPTSSSPR